MQFSNQAAPKSAQQTDPNSQDTFLEVLQDNLGAYVQIEFLIGTQGMTSRFGVLYAVGRNYVVLHDVGNQNYNRLRHLFRQVHHVLFARRRKRLHLPILSNERGIVRRGRRSAGRVFSDRPPSAAPHVTQKACRTRDRKTARIVNLQASVYNHCCSLSRPLTKQPIPVHAENRLFSYVYPVAYAFGASSRFENFSRICAARRLPASFVFFTASSAVFFTRAAASCPFVGGVIAARSAFARFVA